MSQVPPPQIAARRSGCAVGCLVFSIVLFGATVVGSLYFLQRSGHWPF